MKLILYFDGGSRGNPGPAGAGVVLQDAQGKPVYEAGFFLGRMTNNMAEYTGLLRGLEEANRRGATEMTIFADSELVVRQLNGDYRVKNEKLLPLFEAAFGWLKKLERWRINHLPRERNHRADQLANAAMDAGEHVVELDIADLAQERERMPGVIVVLCVRPARSGVCPAPCRQSEELVFDATVPAGLCLGAAAEILRAVEAVRESGKPARVYCPRDGCGACFSIKVG
jgi:ribonuclease HI